MKSLLRRIVLFPLHPRLFSALLKLLRRIRLLPAHTKDLADSPRHILVVNLTTYLGDTVMMMPLLDRLHTTLPNAAIDVITSAAMATFLRQIPYIHHVYGPDLTASRIPVWSTYQKLIRMLSFVRAELYNNPYDLGVLPRWGTDASMSIFLASMTTAPRLIGHHPDDESDGSNPFRAVERLLACISRGGHGLPEAIRELRLLATCGIIESLDLQQEETHPIGALRQIAEHVSLPDLRQKLALNDSPYLVIAPGASHPARRWPPDRFAEVITRLHLHLGARTLIVGSPADDSIACEIVAHAEHATNLTGKTSLAETVALLAAATLVLANDSGPAHIAAGLGVPTLVLSACPATSLREHANSPRRVRPIGPHVLVLQPPHGADDCGERCSADAAHCILGLTVTGVLQQVRSLLGNPKPVEASE